MADSKLHHYVPKMLLRRFSLDPDSENPRLYRLDVTTGQPARTSVRSEAAITHYNRTSDLPGLSPTFVEETLSKVEGAAAPVLDKIRIGLQPSDPDLRLLALFVYLQYQRTPRAREWFRFMDQEAGGMMLRMYLSDPEEVRKRLKEADSSMTDEEVEKMRVSVLNDLLDGKLQVTRGWDGEVAGMFTLAEKIPLMLLNEMTWTVLKAPPGLEFIISDHPVHMYDPDAEGRGVGWLSSPRVQVILPIDRAACLLLQPGEPMWQVAVATPEQVWQSNLRSYAGAEWRIYGDSQGILQEVRRAAKSNRAAVDEFRPRPPHLFTSERMEGADIPHKVNVKVAPERAKIRRFRRAKK